MPFELYLTFRLDMKSHQHCGIKLLVLCRLSKVWTLVVVLWSKECIVWSNELITAWWGSTVCFRLGEAEEEEVQRSRVTLLIRHQCFKKAPYGNEKFRGKLEGKRGAICLFYQWPSYKWGQTGCRDVGVIPQHTPHLSITTHDEFHLNIITHPRCEQQNQCTKPS